MVVKNDFSKDVASNLKSDSSSVVNKSSDFNISDIVD